MFSPFKRRGEEEPGAGGKVIRKKLRALPALPYARPENLLPPPAPQSGNPKWFSGIISGAGRLISSVFRSESEESSSSSSDAGEDHRLCSDEDENGNDLPEVFQQLDENTEGSSLEVRWSERKLAIKQLLLQETFSRDESDALIKIIQSRVVEITEDSRLGAVEIPEKSAYKDLTFLGTWRSMNKGKKFPDGLEYSSNYMNELNGYPQDICNKAVMEAKQWLDKKRLESTPKSDPGLGPCTLNTNRWEDGVGSPIDIARTYMRTRPSWKSPVLSGIESKTPPSGLLLFNDHTPSSLRTDLISSASLEPTTGNCLFSEIDDSCADLSYHDAHQNADEIDPTGSVIDYSLNPSKPLDAPGTPENLSLDYCHADVASSSHGRGGALINILTSLPPLDTSNPADNSLNGEVNAENAVKNEVNNICSTNQIPDLKLESTSIDIPNFILVNDEIQEPPPTCIQGTEQEELASKATSWTLTTSEESFAARRRFDQTPIEIKQYQRSSSKSEVKTLKPSVELRSQRTRNGHGQELVNGSSSDPHVGMGQERHNLAAEQNGGITYMKSTKEILSVDRPATRAVRPRRVAAKTRRGRGR